MELYLPQRLRDSHGEWERESIDGFFISQATKASDSMAVLLGTCILISDQRLTPVYFEVEVAPTRDHIAAYRLRIGEPGGGPLGISGPPCDSKEAASLLYGLVDRLGRVPWAYDVSGPASIRGS